MNNSYWYVILSLEHQFYLLNIVLFMDSIIFQGNVRGSLYIKSTLSTMDTAWTVLKRCPSYRESDKESKDRDQLLSVLQRCPVTRESTVVPIPSGVYTK